jgi:hypothetical protein
MQGIEGEIAKIRAGFFHPLRFRPDEMKPADDISHFPLTANFPGILRDIADPRVRAARNNHQPLTRMIRESGVIEHLVGFHPAIRRADPSLPRIDPFERERPGDFPEEDQIIGDPDRLVRQGYREKPPGFLLAQSRNVERANSIISILNKFGIDTPACTSTLSTINGKRSDLGTALANKDTIGLKTINADLGTLWL